MYSKKTNPNKNLYYSLPINMKVQRKNICNFPLLFSHSINIRMSTLITIIITYYLLIIIIIITTKSHNNFVSVGVMKLCL